MADRLFLSLWYPNFRTAALGPAVLGVLRQFALIGAVPGEAPLIRAAAVYPVSWSESPVYMRIYDMAEGDPGETAAAQPARAVPEAMEQLHEDFAYEFEVDWELWQADSSSASKAEADPLWRKSPSRVQIVAFGPEFDEGAYEIDGQVRISFGLDTPFLQEEVSLHGEAATRVQENIAVLVALVHSIEKNCGISSRLLWSESGESLAEKLLARLQQVN